MDMRRQMVNRLAQEYQAQGDPLGWFERLYQLAERDPSLITWADLRPNPHLVDWAARHGVAGGGRRALVVGCGLGDDAEMLAQLGFEVVAFDISATAIRKARERFPTSSVDYHVADLLRVPQPWRHRFGFVLEAYTLQVLPSALRRPAMNCIAECVAPDGKLLVICRGRDEDKPQEDRVPSPLSRRDLAGFDEQGLQEVSFEDYHDAEDPPVQRFRIVYRVSAEPSRPFRRENDR